MTDPMSIKFIIPTLTPFPTGHAPTFSVLHKMQTELNANANGIRSASGGIYGHLVLTMSPAKYAVLTTNQVYVVPVNPGDNPVHAANATQPQITEANRAHLVSKRVYDTYMDVDLALKTQLLAACPDIYTAAKKQPQVGYGARTTLYLLTHLWAKYGKIEPSQLDENEDLMKTPWHPTEPFEKLIDQLTSTFAFATAGNSGATEKSVVRAGYKILVNTGLFQQELKEWRAKPDTDWTLEIFNDFFSAANTDRLATTKDGGFHSANVTPVTNLAAAAHPSSDLISANLKIAQLEKQLQASKAQAKQTGLDKTAGLATTYCHTHGTSKNLMHTSATCKNKAPGHQDEATEANKMGGSTKVWTAPTAPRV